MWYLKSLNIELMQYGEYKGKFVGKIKFENGDQEAFMFTLTAEQSNEYLKLISKPSNTLPTLRASSKRR